MSDRVGPEAASASEMLEHLLTLHPYSRQIAALPDDQIERLRAMLKQAAAKSIPAQAVYDALTRGFQNAEQTWSSPPLAYEPGVDDRWEREFDVPLLKASA